MSETESTSSKNGAASRERLAAMFGEIVGDGAPAPSAPAATSPHGHGDHDPSRIKPVASRRDVLPINSGTQRVCAGQTVQMTTRPQNGMFRPERFFVSDAVEDYQAPWWKRMWPWYSTPTLRGAADWLLNDITIGNKSQFAQSGSLPGDMFANHAIDSFVSWDVVQTTMDVVVIATYIGAHPHGAAFYGGMFGTSLRFSIEQLKFINALFDSASMKGGES